MAYNEPEYSAASAEWLQKRRAEEERMAADFHAKRQAARASEAGTLSGDAVGYANKAYRAGLRQRTKEEIEGIEEIAARHGLRHGRLLRLYELLDKHPEVAEILDLIEELR